MISTLLGHKAHQHLRRGMLSFLKKQESCTTASPTVSSWRICLRGQARPRPATHAGHHVRRDRKRFGHIQLESVSTTLFDSHRLLARSLRALLLLLSRTLPSPVLNHPRPPRSPPEPMTGATRMTKLPWHPCVPRANDARRRRAVT